jgi:hypothetical protein
MSGRRIFFLLVIPTLMLSCKEDNKASLLIYPAVFYKSGVEATGNLRVFASTGEIRNSRIISRFSQYDTSYLNTYAHYISKDPQIMDSIVFANKEAARLRHEGKYLDCLLATQSDLIILTEKNVTSKCCTPAEVLTRSLPFHMSRQKPEVHSESLYSSTGGNYNFSFTGRSKYVLKESSGKLVAPLILYNLHSKNFVSGFVNNLLSADFYSILGTGDTIAIKEYQFLFEK